ncbi:MAG TPA: alpha-hydroxy-acid oxidizing protein [Thermomicrobiaceae bacterium]|nr:alpha-hydroxy-acid oxidizing protein [Thermomicrobiaceae bacterium]
MARPGLERQLAIYGAGVPPEHPIAPDEWEARAKAILDPGAFGYVAGGAGAEDTMRANRAAFQRWRLRPRYPRDVAERELSIDILGTPAPAPFLLAPVGVLSIVHPEAELAVARAAAATGTPLILSSVSSYTLEQVAEAGGDSPRWFQLYPPKDRDLLASLLRRAERAGYRAIVLTVDTTMLGWRERDLALAYFPFLGAQGVANYFSDPVFRAGLAQPPEADPRAAVMRFLDVFINPSFSWEDVRFVRDTTRLPLLIKGLTHPEDAEEAVEAGADGIVVSNHGGRQVDGAIAALDALPEIAERVAGRVPLLFDSGIRGGADVLKALALGASAVLLGRPYVFGLAVAGADGVEQVIRNLTADLDLTLALCGRRAVAEIDGALVSRVD